MDEQLFWACTLEKMGLAPKPLPAKKANETLLSARLKTVLFDTSYQNNARKIGPIICSTQGV